MMSSTGSRARARSYTWQAGGALAVLALVILTLYSALAAPPGNQHFQRTWERTDQPVLDGLVSRTWMWGPEATSDLITEPYVESPGGQRTVQYYDKARMEITNPNADPSSIWYVTNGLLVVELITGQLQTGDATFEQRTPAQVNVAGDFDDPTGPTYTTFGSLLDAPPATVGSAITARVDRDATVTDDPTLAAQAVTVAVIDEVTSHAIAAPFWDFMNSSGPVHQDGQTLTAPLFENPYFATGRPITEAYWANVKVAGQYREVLMQCFERRCLTYTPGNPDGFVVEAGNVGQHYYQWRYPDGGEETPTTEPAATNTPTATPTETPTASPTATPTEAPVTEYAYQTQWGGPYQPVEGLSGPSSVRVDSNGHLWVVDSKNDRLVEFDEYGIFLRTLGTTGQDVGQFFIPQDVAFGEDGRMYVVDFGNSRVQVLSAAGEYLKQWGGKGATDGKFDGPVSIALRDGVVYVVDRFNYRVQMFDLEGVYQGQFGKKGTGNGEFDAPAELAFDPQGNLFVVDTANSRVQIFTSTGSYLDQFGSDGVANGQLDQPWGIDIDADGYIYVNNSDNERVQKFNPDFSYLTQWGVPGAGFGQFRDSSGLALDSDGNVYVADDANDRIQAFTSEGVFLFELYDASRGRFGNVNAITVDQDGNLLTIDTNKYAYEPGSVSRFTPDGIPLDVLSRTRPDIGQYDQLAGVAVNHETGDIYVIDSFSDRVQRFTATWQARGQWGTSGAAPGQFNGPTAIAIDVDGNVYVADAGNNRIQKFDANGVFLDLWGGVGDGDSQFKQPAGIAIDGERIYVTDNGNDRVQVFERDGDYLGQWGAAGAEPGQLEGPAGIAVNSDGNVLVVDTGNQRVQLFSPDGMVLGGFGALGSGPGQFNVPHGIALDAAGNAYVTDILNHRVQKFAPGN